MVSLLDIIGPVMVGPSSSHTAGACRLCLLARGLVGGTPQSGHLQLHGPLARTRQGPGKDQSPAAGSASTPRPPGSVAGAPYRGPTRDAGGVFTWRGARASTTSSRKPQSP